MTELGAVGRRRQVGVYLAVVAVPVVIAVVTVTRLAGASDHTAGAPATEGSGVVLYRLLIATAAAIAAAAVGGALAARLGQPRVVGELAAGLLMGPSTFGALLPSTQEWLFPAAVLPYLDVLAQFGVVFFMFLIGAELDPGALRRNLSRALTIGQASIALPFLAGVILAWLLRERFQPDGVGTLPFLLFVGVCFAVTAFPVLARILADRQMLRTPLGATAMASAGLGDVTAWCLLAVVIAVLRGTSVASVFAAVASVVVFAVVMVAAVRPLLARLVGWIERGRSRVAVLGGLVCLVLAAAVVTDRLGVHPIFGAFLAGVIMPRHSPLVAELTSKIEGIVVWVMLPLFFVSIGLHTRLGSLADAGQWLICLSIVAVAVAGKLAGTGVAARATGYPWRESLALGVMMNCRGLTELVVLNLGLQLGVLRPELFAMFAVMALLTTAGTGPLLRLVLGSRDVGLASRPNSRADNRQGGRSMQFHKSMTDLIGNTPLVQLVRVADEAGPMVLAKVEYLNPGGSVKDRIAMKMIDAAEQSGELKQGGTIVEPTSGNTGVGLSLIAQQRGYRYIFVCPDKVSIDKINVMKAYGAEVVVCPTAVPPEDPGSYYQVSDRLAREIQDAWKPDQYTNPNNPLAHYESTGPEIWRQTEGRITHFVAGIGTGGTISGVGRYLHEVSGGRVRVVGADPVGSVYSGGDGRPYLVEGVGEDFWPTALDRTVLDEVVPVEDGAAFAMTRRLAREEGLLVGGSSGMAVVAALEVAARAAPDSVVVVLLPDGGRGYLSKIFDDDWMSAHGFEPSAGTGPRVGDLLAAKSASLPALVWTHLHDTIDRAVASMRHNGVSQLPVFSHEPPVMMAEVVGAVHESELLDAMVTGTARAADEVSQHISAALPIVGIGASLGAALSVLSSRGAALVIANGRPCGVLTRQDVLGHLMRG